MENKNENKKHVENIAEELIAIYNGEVFDEYGEQVGFLDYFADVLDINYVVESDRKTLKGVRLLVAFGGPNIWVDTLQGKIQLFWWTEYAETWLPSEVCNAINDDFDILWNC